MRITKVLVLTIVLAMTGYVYASGVTQTKGDGQKASCCKAKSCCTEKQDCCASGAQCCKDTAQCCKSNEGCSGKDQHCSKGDNNCCVAGSDNAKGQCCAAEADRSKPDKNGAGGCCKKTAVPK